MPPALRSVLLLAPLGGCTLVYEIGVGDSGSVALEPDLGPVTVGAGGTEAPATETCNGVDDDGDGLVDEGYEDLDGDGVADCDGPTCPALDLGVAGEVGVVAACAGSTSTIQSPWSASLRWRWTNTHEAFVRGGVSALILGQLDDDNRDGVLDDRDSPDLVVQSALPARQTGGEATGTTFLLRAASGEQVWSYGGGSWAGPLLLDTDADGVPEVVTQGPSATLTALDIQGRVLWSSSPSADEVARVPVGGDLLGDGRFEILYGSDVLDARTGRTAFSLDEPLPSATGSGVVADLDLDGRPEILFQGQLLDGMGNLRWKADVTGRRSLWPIVLQADEDQEAEIAWTGRDYSLWEMDGTLLADVPSVGSSDNGAPCAGDLDGDGHVEIAWVTPEEILAVERDGTVMWRLDRTSDVVVGCSAFDLDGDNASEVFVHDGDVLHVLDGASGVANLSLDVGFSASRDTYPLLADLDDDDHAEVILGGGDEHGAVVAAYGHGGGGWAPSGSSWPSYDYAVGNIQSNGYIPGWPGAWWDEFASFRGRPAGDLVSRPDLSLQLTDVCVADCEFGPVRVAIQVYNQGGRDQYAGGILAFYVGRGGSLERVAEAVLPSVPMGEAMSAVELDLPPAAMDADAWVVRIEDDGSDADFLSDCDDDNQQLRLVPPACP